MKSSASPRKRVRATIHNLPTNHERVMTSHFPENYFSSLRPALALILLFLFVASGCGDEKAELPPTEPEIRLTLTLTLAPDTLALEEGTLDTLVATVRDAGGVDVTRQYMDAVAWSTSDSALVTVADGVLSATGGPGWATVTATLGYSEGEEVAQAAVAAYPFRLDIAFNPDRPDSLGIDTLEVTESTTANLHVGHEFAGVDGAHWRDSVTYTVLDGAAAVEPTDRGQVRLRAQQSGTVRLEAAIEARGKRFADTLSVFVREPAPLVLSADSVHLDGVGAVAVVTATFRGAAYHDAAFETVTVAPTYPQYYASILDGAALSGDTLKLAGPGHTRLRVRGPAGMPWILPADLVVTGEVSDPIVFAMDAPAEITQDGTPITLRGINLLQIDPATITAGADTVALLTHTDTTLVFSTEVYSVGGMRRDGSPAPGRSRRGRACRWGLPAAPRPASGRGHLPGSLRGPGDDGRRVDALRPDRGHRTGSAVGLAQRILQRRDLEGFEPLQPGLRRHHALPVRGQPALE